jgi:hypothetical protein
MRMNFEAIFCRSIFGSLVWTGCKIHFAEDIVKTMDLWDEICVDECASSDNSDDIGPNMYDLDDDFINDVISDSETSDWSDSERFPSTKKYQTRKDRFISNAVSASQENVPARDSFQLIKRRKRQILDSEEDDKPIKARKKRQIVLSEEEEDET